MDKKLIGKHLNSQEAKAAGFDSEWPIIDSNGIITGSYDGDCVPEDAVLVEWSTNTTKGKAIIVDGMHGFEAVLEA